jgi:gamma-tubulin complex component 2
VASIASTVETRPSSSRHREVPIASSSKDSLQPSSSSSRPSSSSSRHRREPLPEPDTWRERNGKKPEKETSKGVERESVITVQVEVGGDEDEELARERERMLGGVPLEIQEAWICEDIMFVLQVS